jgi:3-oxoacyl-[acyl-carrier protein] reductase
MAQMLSGKVALVTGGSRGIGAASARALADEGADVAISYSSSADQAKAVVADLEGRGVRAAAFQADQAVAEQAAGLIHSVVEHFGRLDILVNNAGIYEFLPLEAITAEHFHKHFDLNVLGLLLTTQEAVKHFGSSGGSIVNISTFAAGSAPPNTSVYSSSKAAVNAITRSLAQELGPRKIRVNAVSPGGVETEGLHAAGISGGDFDKQMVAQTPLGRIGQPQDIAPAVVFLVSPESAWITSENLYVSGGLR